MRYRIEDFIYDTRRWIRLKTYPIRNWLHKAVEKLKWVAMSKEDRRKATIEKAIFEEVSREMAKRYEELILYGEDAYNKKYNSHKDS